MVKKNQKNQKNTKSPDKSIENDDWIVDDGPLDEDIRQEVKKLAYDLGKSHSKQFCEYLDKKYN